MTITFIILVTVTVIVTLIIRGNTSQIPISALNSIADFFLDVETNHLRSILILRILRPRIFESKFRDHCAEKLDVALRNLPPSFKNLFGSNSEFEDS